MTAPAAIVSTLRETADTHVPDHAGGRRRERHPVMTASVPAVTAPAANPQNVALVLRMAADRIAEYGLWRGECRQVGERGDCAITGIARAARTVCEGHAAALVPLKDAAFAALAAHLAVPADCDFVGRVIDWNDMTRHDDPQAMVCQGLRDTADEVLAGGDQP